MKLKMFAIFFFIILQINLGELSRCTDLKDCVQCKIHSKGPIAKNACPISCKLIEPIRVEAAKGNFKIDDHIDVN